MFRCGCTISKLVGVNCDFVILKKKKKKENGKNIMIIRVIELYIRNAICSRSGSNAWKICGKQIL